MSSWQQRGDYLVEVSQRSLKGHKTFDLCRSHLVKASQISKGTIYNHFPTEADLMVSVAIDNLNSWYAQTELDKQNDQTPLMQFLFHQCWRLHDILVNKNFVIERVMPNAEILLQASEVYQLAYKKSFETYISWFNNIVNEIGKVEGFNRAELVLNYLRGTMINSDDAEKDGHDPQLYHQFCYAIVHLLGHSDKRLPGVTTFQTWLNHLPQQQSAA
ncbi:TetR/AcrR family transcriptional regulator [Shewanella intestini]|uniref:TetR/AcrR family transcriptional regulator n=1 Tax=Shewanella intestini TaxID=2017544 RepID=A0ABS5I4V6_9GAMM|nr:MULTISPECIES: TetR/AcrR family transcriptional regulator [Shewanella]MBR9728868.1 TetR/AcrR family transcriptional regulator [Shewanella intestini]MRG37066.1 TetR/AcrR family transcriptional regulator [Shewanella sp. XMDDZSB0408]